MTDDDREARVREAAELRRKSAIALGVAIISFVFLVETSIAHHAMPSPHSPVVWTVLGVMLLGGVVMAVWFSRRAHELDGGTRA
jgi:dipeptide/tripeptide permease